MILLFSVYSLANKKVLFCKWVLESETGNIIILRKAPYIFWFSNMLISFWLCLFVIKLYSLNNIFKYIRKKDGKYIYNIIRSLKTLKAKYQKAILDLKFIKTSKKEELIPRYQNAMKENFGTHGNFALIFSCMSLFQLNYVESITILWFLYCGV